MHRPARAAAAAAKGGGGGGRGEGGGGGGTYNSPVGAVASPSPPPSVDIDLTESPLPPHRVAGAIAAAGERIATNALAGRMKALARSIVGPKRTMEKGKRARRRDVENTSQLDGYCS